ESPPGFARASIAASLFNHRRRHGFSTSSLHSPPASPADRVHPPTTVPCARGHSVRTGDGAQERSLVALGRRRRRGLLPRRGDARCCRLDEGLGHVLRREQRRRHHGRRLRVRQPVLDGVRDGHGGAEHVPLQRRGGVRGVLPGAVRPGQLPELQAGGDGHHHRHQPLPDGLLQAQRQRRLVQPAAQAPGHGAARVGAHRRLPRRHRAHPVPAGVLLQERRRAVHHQRQQLLRAGAHHQRRRAGVGQGGADQGVPHRVDHHVPELGRELAVQQLPQRAVHLLRRHRHQRPEGGLPGRGAQQLGVRPDLHQLRPVLLAIP
uniref:Uncharacterized protein n=1 Tax=Aegilops tauschii subsp. strangulata TaxID=200361 RepID=A0A453ISL3_AEGTS